MWQKAGDFQIRPVLRREGGWREGRREGGWKEEGGREGERMGGEGERGRERCYSADSGLAPEEKHASPLIPLT